MKRLKELRTREGINQQDVANILNVQRITISRYENGEREASYETLVKLAEYFNVSVDYLLERTDNPTPPNKKDEKKEACKETSKEDIMFAFFGEVDSESVKRKYADVEKFVDFLNSKEEDEE